MKEPAHKKHTMKKELRFVGLDVHAKSLTLAFAEGGGGEARIYGTLPNDRHALEKVFTKLRSASTPEASEDSAPMHGLIRMNGPA